MKIVDWEEFQTMPTGTVFQEWTNHSLGELQILGNVIAGTFVSASLLPACIEGRNLTRGHRLDGAYALISMPSSHAMDKNYDLDKRMWLVWDEADRRRLAGWLLSPENGAAAQNEEDVIYEVPRRFHERD